MKISSPEKTKMKRVVKRNVYRERERERERERPGKERERMRERKRGDTELVVFAS